MSISVFLLVLLAAVAHALWNFLAKKIPDRSLALWQGLWVVNLALLPFSLWLVAREGCPWQALPFILASGVAHTFYFVTLMRSYEQAEISSAYPIARGLGVGGTALAALLILQEGISLLGGIGVLLICAGVLLIGLAGHGRLRMTVWPLLTGLCTIVYSVVDKAAAGRCHPLVYINALTLTAILLQTPLILSRYGRMLSTYWRGSWRSSLLVGGGSLGTYLLILFAFRLERASYIVAVREFSVVIAALLGVLLLRERLSAGKAAGLLAVTAGLVLIRLG